jgi:hypothetical protein
VNRDRTVVLAVLGAVAVLALASFAWIYGGDLTSWGAEIRSSCRSEFVFVDEAAEEVVPPDVTSVLPGA